MLQFGRGAIGSAWLAACVAMRIARSFVTSSSTSKKLAVFILLMFVPLLSGQTAHKVKTTGEGNGGAGAGGAMIRLIIIPDTQKMFSTAWNGTPDMMRSAITWIIAQNPSAVLIVGDIVHSGCIDTVAWDSAGVVYAPLIASGIPYVAVNGNHDSYGCVNTDSSFNLLFNTTDYASNSWYGGAYGGGANTTNTFSFFTADNGQQFIVVGLQFVPTAAHLSWAESLFTAYPGRTGILVNHDLMWNNGWSTNGLMVYDSLKSNKNLDFMFGGHFDALMNVPPESGQPHWQKTWGGGTITTMLANWQNDTLGGSGIVMVVDIDSGLGTIKTKAYSAHSDSLVADTVGTMYGRPTGYTLDWEPFKGHPQYGTCECPPDTTVAPGALFPFVFRGVNTTANAADFGYVIQGDAPLVFAREDAPGTFVPIISGSIDLSAQMSETIPLWAQLGTNATQGYTLHAWMTLTNLSYPQYTDTCETFIYVQGTPVFADPVAVQATLRQNWPNPFNPNTTIAFTIPAGAGPVSLTVFDVAGRVVRRFGAYSPGIHTIRWDGRNNSGLPVSSGVYLYRLDGASLSLTRKMVLVR